MKKENPQKMISAEKNKITSLEYIRTRIDLILCFQPAKEHIQKCKLCKKRLFRLRELLDTVELHMAEIGFG